jgi:hypothetical protein
MKNILQLFLSTVLRLKILAHFMVYYFIHRGIPIIIISGIMTILI